MLALGLLAKGWPVDWAMLACLLVEGWPVGWAMLDLLLVEGWLAGWVIQARQLAKDWPLGWVIQARQLGWEAVGTGWPLEQGRLAWLLLQGLGTQALLLLLLPPPQGSQAQQAWLWAKGWPREQLVLVRLLAGWAAGWVPVTDLVRV